VARGVIKAPERRASAYTKSDSRVEAPESRVFAISIKARRLGSERPQNRFGSRGAYFPLNKSPDRLNEVPNLKRLKGNTTMKATLLRLWNEEEGQDLTEYALLLVLLTLAAIGSLTTLATAVNSVFANAKAALSTT
jgi:Flp pilus assembly pilin Flp